MVECGDLESELGRCPKCPAFTHKGQAEEVDGSVSAPEPTRPPRRLRVYQAWQGNETFFCWGLLITGPNWKPVFGTLFILIAPVVIYLVFVASYMTFYRSPAIMVFSLLLPILAIIFLFMTSCSDPGIIPRRQPDEEYLQGRKPRTKEMIVNNHRIITRYNDTCHFYQPPRAHHCSVNDNCIERFDHHCPWVGTTVGKRNYRSFLLFIYSSTLLCLYAFGNSLAQLFVKHQEVVNEARERGESTDDKWGESISETIPAIVIMAYTFLIFWFVGGLSGFHAYLVATNQTTYETFRYRHEDRPNPYDRGVILNCAEVWCAPCEPSKVNFRAFIDEVGQPNADLELGEGPYTANHHPTPTPPAPSVMSRTQPPREVSLQQIQERQIQELQQQEYRQQVLALQQRQQQQQQQQHMQPLQQDARTSPPYRQVSHVSQLPRVTQESMPSMPRSQRSSNTNPDLGAPGMEQHSYLEEGDVEVDGIDRGDEDLVQGGSGLPSLHSGHLVHVPSGLSPQSPSVPPPTQWQNHRPGDGSGGSQSRETSNWDRGSGAGARRGTGS